MNNQTKSGTEKLQKPAGPADHLANERTFLAWIRTSIALIGLGFVVVKFALFIRQMQIILGQTGNLPVAKGHSTEIGIAMVAVGAIIALLAYLRYLTIEKQLYNEAFAPSRWLLAFLTLIIVAGSLVMVLKLAQA